MNAQENKLLRRFRLVQLFAVLLPICHAQAANNTLKKFLILDFKNIEADPNFQYLEASITDAVRDKLKEQFAFKDMSRDDILKFSSENMLSPEDFHTQSVAFQLGLLLKQDIVINGSFKFKKGQITTSVKIFDIGQKKVLKEIQMTGPASGEIFQTIDKIAARIADETKSILPNKDEWQRSGAKEDVAEGLAKLNSFSLTTGFAMLATPTAFSGEITSATKLNPADITGSMALSLGYSRHDFYKKLLAWGNIGYQFGRQDFSIEKNTVKVGASLSLFYLRGGLGYHIPMIWKMYLVPILGGGYYLGSIRISYANLPVKPLNPTTLAEEDSRTLNMTAPTVLGGLRFGFQMNRLVGFEVSGEYLSLFYAEKTTGLFFINGGMTFKI